MLHNTEQETKSIYVPIHQKLTLSVEEAVAYTGIGINKIYSMLNTPNCPFALYIGNRRLVKRQAFEDYINSKVAI